MPLRAQHILHREHITEQLSAAVAHHPLVVITAPTGYGKTVAAQELAEHLAYKTYFLTAPLEAQSLAYQWERLCSQLHTQGAELAEGMLRMGFPANTTQLQRMLEQWCEALANTPTLLVLDDYQAITAPEIGDFLAGLVRLRIPSLHIVVLSRSRPNLPLEDFRLKGLAALFTQDLLAFSEHDAINLFKAQGVSNNRAAKQAWKDSEGWPAALWLSLCNFQATGALSPTSDIEHLLEATLLHCLDMDERRLMLAVSTLPSFTPQQATFIMEDPATPRRLRSLLEKNAFINFDPGTETYRMHSILRDILQRRMAEGVSTGAASIDKGALYLRIGNWFAGADDPLLAMQFFTRAGTDDALVRILQLFENKETTTYLPLDPERVTAMVNAIPWRVRIRCPLGYLTVLYHYMAHVENSPMGSVLDEAEGIFTAAESLDEATKGKVLGEIELLRSVNAFNDLVAMREYHMKAYTLLKKQPSSIARRDNVWNFCCPHVAFLYLRSPGTYARMVDNAEKHLHIYQELSNGCGAGAQDLARAEFLLETGSVKRVEHFLMKSSYRATLKEQYAVVMGVNFTQARLDIAQERSERAMQLMQEVATQVAKTTNPFIVNTADLFQGYIAAVLDMPEAIPLWLRQGDLEKGHTFYQSRGFAYLVHAKALLATGQWAQLEAMAEDLPRFFEPYQNLLGFIHAYLLQAMAAQHFEKEQKAKTLLRKALKLAKPDHILTSIAEYGNHLEPLLRQLAGEGERDTYLTAIINLAKKHAKTHNPQPKLAPREQEVLELALLGESNAAIATTLGIKPITVGKTLTRVYAKLGVKNRVAAVQKWRELNS